MWETISYISNAPYFWLSMGMTTAVAIFVGAIVYDGELNTATKGIISIGLYGFFIFQTGFTRISSFLAKYPETYTPRSYAGLVTILFITFFWLTGVLLGVLTSYWVRKRK